MHVSLELQKEINEISRPIEASHASLIPVSNYDSSLLTNVAAGAMIGALSKNPLMGMIGGLMVGSAPVKYEQAIVQNSEELNKLFFLLFTNSAEELNAILSGKSEEELENLLTAIISKEKLTILNLASIKGASESLSVILNNAVEKFKHKPKTLFKIFTLTSVQTNTSTLFAAILHNNVKTAEIIFDFIVKAFKDRPKYISKIFNQNNNVFAQSVLEVASTHGYDEIVNLIINKYKESGILK